VSNLKSGIAATKDTKISPRTQRVKAKTDFEQELTEATEISFSDFALV
jgi:hypothetical protein